MQCNMIQNSFTAEREKKNCESENENKTTYSTYSLNQKENKNLPVLVDRDDIVNVP